MDLEVNRCKSCGFVYLASWEQSLAKSQELYDYYGRLSEDDLTRRYSPGPRAGKWKAPQAWGLR